MKTNNKLVCHDSCVCLLTFTKKTNVHAILKSSLVAGLRRGIEILSFDSNELTSMFVPLLIETLHLNSRRCTE